MTPGEAVCHQILPVVPPWAMLADLPSTPERRWSPMKEGGPGCPSLPIDTSFGKHIACADEDMMIGNNPGTPTVQGNVYSSVSHSFPEPRVPSVNRTFQWLFTVIKVLHKVGRDNLESADMVPSTTAGSHKLSLVQYIKYQPILMTMWSWKTISAARYKTSTMWLVPTGCCPA